MPYLLSDLIVTRVDLVDEGANSAAFIELYKRKEQKSMTFEEILSQMNAEHAATIQGAIAKAKGELDINTALLTTTQADLAKAKQDLADANAQIDGLKSQVPCSCDGEEVGGLCKVCGKVKKAMAFDEVETMKSLPKEAREFVAKLKSQKEAAEAEVLKAKEAEVHATAVSKAAELKSLPIDADKLVGIIKSADKDLLDVLSTLNAAIEGTVFNEVGKRGGEGNNNDAWTKIETKATEIAKARSITQQKAIGEAIKENPELYKEYLKGGAN